MALKIKTITVRTIDNEDFKQQILHLGFCEIGNINPLSKEEIEQSVNLSRIKEN